MIERIPPALLQTRIGGHLSEAHETRKVCFLSQAPEFLRQLVAELGPLAGTAMVQKDPKTVRESGVVSYDSESIILEIYEDALKRDGLKLHCHVNGNLQTSAWLQLTTLNKDANLWELVQKLRADLEASRPH